MILIKNCLFFTLLLFLFSCNSSSNDAGEYKPPQSMLSEDAVPKEVEEKKDPYQDWERNHGIGPIEAFEFDQPVDSAMVKSGKAVFDTYCILCHKEVEDFIGPPMKDIYKRRTPAWTMNIILNPTEMILNDPIAKQLFIDYNSAPMGYQNISKEDARAMLEYFRTL